MELRQLHKNDDLSDFDCDKKALNDWLKNFALINMQNSSATTYIFIYADKVVGYYSLATGGISKAMVPNRVAKGLAGYDVPIILIARLAVDKRFHGRGIGTAMLKDAFKKAISHSRDIASRAILVHAKDAEARAFYLKNDFEDCPIPEADKESATMARRMAILMKDALAIVNKA